jgi:hypothetical protein
MQRFWTSQDAALFNVVRAAISFLVSAYENAIIAVCVIHMF